MGTIEIKRRKKKTQEERRGKQKARRETIGSRGKVDREREGRDEKGGSFSRRKATKKEKKVEKEIWPLI